MANSQTLNPFPTTDSLRKFVNKWIRNSAVDAFTNLRLNTALIGMSRFLDSADAAGSAVTGFVAINDTTIRLTTNNLDTFYATLPGRRIIARGGLSKRNDTLFMGGRLDSFQLIQTYTRKNVPLGPAIPFTALVLANQSDSIEIPFLKNGTTSDRSLLYLHKYYLPDDTANASYGGLLSGINRVYMDSIQKTYVRPSRPYFWTYSGFNIASQIRNPDSMYLQTSPYGHTGGSNMENAVGGDQAKYWIQGFSQSNISSPYPISSYRSGLDLARVSSAGKRETYGPGYAGYIWDWRNHQLAINSGSTEYGSYVGRITGFYAYGLLSTQSTSPSKAKTLLVSTADTVIGVRIAPMWGATNEVKNGYGVVAEGTNDDNHMAGRLRVGGALPLNGGQVSQFQVYDTVPTATFGPASFIDASSQVGLYALQNGVTTATITARKTRGLYVWKETNYSGFANLNSKFQNAILGYNVHAADSALAADMEGGGDGSGSQMAIAWRKKTGWLDTTYFIGGTAPRRSPNGLSVIQDFSQSGLVNVTRLNWGKGHFSAITALFNLNSWHRVENANWFTGGGGQDPGPNSQIDTGVIYRAVQLSDRVLNPYAFKSDGIRDSVVISGPMRVPYMPTGGSSDSVVVIAAGGVFKRVLQSSISGAAPALTTNYIGVGASSVLSGSSAYTYDGTSVKQENSGAIGAITSTTAVGSTSGGVLNLYAKDLPTAANQVLGTINFGSRNGTTADNAGIRLRAATNGAWVDGSAEQAYFTVETNATGTLNEIMRWTANGRVGIGAVSNPTARVHIAAGFASAGGAPFKLTSGTNLTSFESGAIEFDGNNFYQSNTIGRGVLEKTRNQVVSAGTFSIDGTASHYVFSGTTSTWTLPVAASSTNMTIYIKNRGSGNITLNSNSGGNDIYDTSAVNTLTITPGSSVSLSNDGTYFNVYHL